MNTTPNNDNDNVDFQSDPLLIDLDTIPNNDQALDYFNRLNREIKVISAKIDDLVTDLEEHKLVIQTLHPLEKQRKCYRLINDVLVERNVAQVLPALETNQNKIAQLINSLKTQHEKYLQFQNKIKNKYPDMFAFDDNVN